jgi:Bacterial membrane protein YfhO
MPARFKINKSFWSYVFVFIWPFIYCYKYIITGESFSLTIDNDFNFLYYNYKVYLLDKLSNFSFPLWSPSEACGFPFYFNPFTQSLYPLNALLVLFYKINSGYSYADHQKFAVLGISIFAVGLLLWLRLLKFDLKYAVFSVCIVTISFKITEILRFPNAIHSIAWLPFILYACTLSLNKNKSILSGIIIFASVVMMITAGYPYYFYYSFFLILPYIIIIIYLKKKKYCFGEYDFDMKKYLLSVCISFAAAFALCYPYLIKVKEVLAQTVDRSGNSFEYSTSPGFTLSNTIGSLIFPPESQMEGWYYFGMISLLLVSAMYIYVFININKSRFKIQSFILLTVLIWYIVISYITYGKSSYLFIFLWNYLPQFSGLRVWGRLNIIFLPVMAYLLACAIGIFMKILSGNKNKVKKKQFLIFIIFFVSVYSIFLITQIIFLNENDFDPYWTNYFKNTFEDFNENIFIINGVLSFGVIMLSIILTRFVKPGKKYWSWIIPVTFFIVNVIDLLPAGSRQWAIPENPDTQRTIIKIDLANFNSLNSPRYFKYGTVSNTQNFLTGYIANWHYERYLNFLKSNGITDYINTQEKMPVYLKDLLGLTDGKRIFCSENIDYISPQEFVSDSKNFEADNMSYLKIIKYNGDELEFEISTRQPCYCSFIDNWDPDWKATVNGKDVNIEKLFGTFKSVKLEKGNNIVKLKYSPKLFYVF